LAGAVLGVVALGVAFVSEWFEWDAGWFLLILGLLIHTLGLVLFGLANLRARLLPRLNWLPLAAGLIGGPIPLVVAFWIAPDTDWPLWLMVGGLGLGWIALGALTWLAARRSAPESVPA